MAFEALNQQVLDEVRQGIMAAPVAQSSGGGARFVVELPLEMTPEVARQAVANALNLEADQAIQIEPLFEVANPDYGMHHFWVLTLAMASPDQAGMFDIAYALRDTCGFAAVDPDVPDSVYFLAQEAAPPVSSQLEQNGIPDNAPPPNWSLKNIRADRAWALTPPPGGATKGKGIVIAHPDTGWAEHPDVDKDDLDLARAKNILTGTSDARNPLNAELEGLLLYPGHGTSAASVAVTLFPGKNPPPTPKPDPQPGLIGLLVSLVRVLTTLWQAISSVLRLRPVAVSQVAASADVDVPPGGVAPDAKLIPIRYSDTVIVTSGVNLARAIHYAASQEADIILITSGGVATSWLEAAVQDAVNRQNCIIVASAGNVIPVVAAPALYPQTVAAAGTNAADRPWSDSAYGPEVTIAAPAELVWRATFDGDHNMEPKFWPGSGTSFSAPNVAGAIALWLAYHGRDTLRQRYQGRATLHEVLLRLLEQTRRVPESWTDEEKAKYGGGIVDAETLLRAPLPDPESFTPPSTWSPLPSGVIIQQMTQKLSLSTVSAKMPVEQRALAAALSLPIARFDDLPANYGGEVIRLLYAQHAPQQGTGAQGASALAHSRRLRAVLDTP